MERKKFLLQLFSLSAWSWVPVSFLQAFASHTTKTLTLLSTNDVHSRIDPFPANAGRLAHRGGFARRATLLENIRKKVPHTLLLDAGDIFQGTPYFNLYGGELELRLMSEMQYDAATLGNHEFDNGIAGFEKQLPHANFPFLSANYDFSRTSLAHKIQAYEIFQKGDMKVGVFGLGVALEGLVSPELYESTKYEDPIRVSEKMVRTLRAAQCDLIICLSHLGYNYPREPGKISDRVLAKNTEGIDVIIGGHTHTFLDIPQVWKNKKGKPVIISQLGWGGVLVGRIDISIQPTGEKIWAYKNYLISEKAWA